MDENKAAWWVSVIAIAAVSLCCFLPALAAFLGISAVSAAALHYGLAGALIVGAVSLGIYLLLRSVRKHGGDHCATCVPTKSQGPSDSIQEANRR